MDERLVAWARAVKRRRPGPYPTLWLFTDAARLPDPLPAVARLPRGRCGVVLRHDGAPKRADLARKVARACRARRLMLVVAGDARLAAALGAGVHLRDGRWPGLARVAGPRTSSAHDAATLRRARAAGAAVIFLSPAFTTASHAGAAALGAWRWARLAQAGGAAKVFALGGVTGGNIRRLGPKCYGAGAISALG